MSSQQCSEACKEMPEEAVMEPLEDLVGDVSGKEARFNTRNGYYTYQNEECKWRMRYWNLGDKGKLSTVTKILIKSLPCIFMGAVVIYAMNEIVELKYIRSVKPYYEPYFELMKEIEENEKNGKTEWESQRGHETRLRNLKKRAEWKWERVCKADKDDGRFVEHLRDNNMPYSSCNKR